VICAYGMLEIFIKLRSNTGQKIKLFTAVAVKTSVPNYLYSVKLYTRNHVVDFKICGLSEKRPSFK
jgi:hypothetical protein